MAGPDRDDPPRALKGMEVARGVLFFFLGAAVPLIPLAVIVFRLPEVVDLMGGYVTVVSGGLLLFLALAVPLGVSAVLFAVGFIVRESVCPCRSAMAQAVSACISGALYVLGGCAVALILGSAGARFPVPPLLAGTVFLLYAFGAPIAIPVLIGRAERTLVSRHAGGQVDRR